MNEKSNQAKRQQFSESNAKKYSAILTPRIIKTASLNGIAVERIGTLEILERFFKVDFFVASCPSVVWFLLSVGHAFKKHVEQLATTIGERNRTTTSSAKLQVTKSRCCHAWQARPDNYGHGYERVSGAIHRTVKPANMTIRKVNTRNSRSGIGF